MEQKAVSIETEGISPQELHVEGGIPGTDYTYRGSELTVLTETPMTISNLEGVVTADHIEVDLDPEKTANITLAGVNIDTSDAYEVAALQVISGKLNLTLADGSANTLQSGEECAGLQNDEHELMIQCEGAGTEGHSCDANCGALTAAGGDGAAGIGGGNWMNGENITIRGGAVTATGGLSGAGIGGGDRRGNGNNITILGGTVTASAGYGAGIGGGSERDASNIVISGGTVTAMSRDGAGIGGGHWGKADGIHISGGTVTASGGEASAGIGSSAWSDGSDITISGGTVTAAGGENGAGIGGGQYGNGVNITISGGMVTANRGENAASIGGGELAESVDIIISGGLFGEGGCSGQYGVRHHTD